MSSSWFHSSLEEVALTYIEQNDVHVGEGYPRPTGHGVREQLEALIFIEPKPDNLLCAAGNAKRRKRDAGIAYSRR